MDEEKIAEEARFDGKWVLRTNNASLSAENVALRYKELWQVESLFRDIKSLLETRPIYHKLDETIRGNVFCSFLALVLAKELESRLSRTGCDAEWSDILRDLDALQETEVVQDGKRFLLRTDLRGCCGKVLQAVGVAVPPTVRQLESSPTEVTPSNDKKCSAIPHSI